MKYYVIWVVYGEEGYNILDFDNLADAEICFDSHKYDFDVKLIFGTMLKTGK